MIALARRYMKWLHTGWPAGVVEKLPESGEDGATAVPGVRIVGDLTGIPLLKFSAHTGARAVQAILAESDFRAARTRRAEGVCELAIVGAGVAGTSAAIEARKAGLDFTIFEASEPFSTIVNFPKHKPIYTYPTDMTPAGHLRLGADVKEALVDELQAQRNGAGVEPLAQRIVRIERKDGAILLHGADESVTRALRVIVAIGRSGNFRKLGVPGEDLPKVFNRLHDPKDFAGQDALVVGGGDSAIETALALALCGARVTLSYRRTELSRPKPENLEKLDKLRCDPTADVAVERPTSERVTTAASPALRGERAPGRITLALGTQPLEIRDKEVVLKGADGAAQTLPNDVVFTMLGREAPLEFFRRSGLPVRGEWRPVTWAGFAAFLAFCVFVYNWKSGGALTALFRDRGWFPFGVPDALRSLGGALGSAASDPTTFLGTLAISLAEPGFYYSLAYCTCVLAFGITRIRRRRTPYVKAQTLTLMAVQLVPLFLLPYLVLPWLGHNGVFDAGFGRLAADNLFPIADYTDHGREYWRAFGFILAWPLFIWNFFTPQPMWWWLAIGLVQTFVIIPYIVIRWGKRAYCGWICSCGALAETLGDTHRHKMPHGPIWNRVNMTGQVILATAFLLFAARIVSWSFPGTRAGDTIGRFYEGLLSGWSLFGAPLNYYKVVDLFLAGIVGVGFYFWFSGRVWCRFACPLAALMHIYARFTKFRIFADKKKCISCNVCTSVCHQGIDIMNFANKGVPMADPECVGCSACVQMCPTGTLTFGRFDGDGKVLLDPLPASLVQMAESQRKHT
jgi:thioredoxin reductase/polyferredoxin